MVKHTAQTPAPAAAHHQNVGWPSSVIAGTASDVIVRLEIDGTSIRLVRAIENAGATVTKIEAWGVECENDSKTADF